MEAAGRTGRVAPVDDAKSRAGAPSRKRLRDDTVEERSVANETKLLLNVRGTGLRV